MTGLRQEEENHGIYGRFENWRATALLLMIYDVFAVNAAYFLGLWFRFDCRFTQIDPPYLEAWRQFAPVYTIICIAVFAWLRLYRSLWRFASDSELIQVMLSSVVTTLVHIGATVLFYRRMPVSYYCIGAMLQFFLVLGIRFAYRIFLLFRRRMVRDEGDRVMLIGAGAAGQIMIREILRSDELHMELCCVIDDNPNKKGRLLEGIPIVGGRETIPDMVEKYRVNHIIFAIPAIDAADKRDILNICKDTGCVLQTVPGVYQLINGDVSISKLQKVDIQDLLGREPIRVNNEEILKSIDGKVILVTGGGGSIGSELCRQIATAHPRQLVILDMYENNAYDIQQELKRTYPNLNLVVLIGSVRNTSRMNWIMKTYRPQVVFHAAAHKHVPLMEDSPNEAIKNNVMGTYKTAVAAAKAGVEKFVLISTDKAVNPTNIMGASKRLCEMVVQMMDRKTEGTDYVAVRFGNVLGSNGSVIPLFKKQIAQGGPVTVTDKNIIRYFMTIPEAVSLVLQAAYYARGGEIFVLDMGEPVRIDDMARNLIRLSGLTPDVDIKIEYTGLRPGEKLYEELLMDEEGLQETENKLIYIGKPIEMDDEWFAGKLKELDKASKQEVDRMKQIVAEIVPTYHPEKAF